MKISDKTSSLFWLAFAFCICFESIRLPLGTFSAPGAGFLPLCSGLILGILSFIQLLQAHRRKTKRELAVFQDKEIWKNVVFVLGALFAYPAILQILGFMLTTFLFLLFLFRIIQPQRWILAIVGSAFAAFLSHLMFEIWLKAQLPKGIFGI